MSAAKWIGGIIGFMAGGPLGALAGYAIGSLFSSDDDDKQNYNPYQGRGEYSHGGGYNGYGRKTIRGYQEQRNSFLFSLLVMASYIIKADGKVMHSEMEYVRDFLRRNFGPGAMQQGEQILLNLFEQRKQMDRNNPLAFKQTIRECGAQIADNLPTEQRLQLLAFLAEIAKADGSVCQAEVEALKEVAESMRLSKEEVLSMLNLGGNTVEEAYKVLEVDPSATNEEVKAAYRKLALKHHPDRVATLGEDVKKAAEEKFQQINNAKEIIYKARNMR